MSRDDKAAALRAAIEAALAAYNAEEASVPPLGSSVVITTPDGEEIPARDHTSPKLAPGNARERARADYERRHPRRPAS